MNAFVSFAGVKEKAKIEDVVKWLGIMMRHEKQTLRGTCPQCGGDRSLAVTPNHQRTDGSIGSYYCHEDKKGGDVIGLVAHVKQVSQHEAAKMLSDHFGGGSPRENTSPKPQKATVDAKSRTFDPEAYVKRLDPAHELLQPLGLSPETLTAWKAGYASSGVHRGRLALPLYKDGKLVGHFARSLTGESPLLSFVAGQNPVEHIFGAHLVTDGELSIARDPLDVLTAYENGVSNVVAFLTDGIRAEQWEMLSSLMDERKCECSHLY